MNESNTKAKPTIKQQINLAGQFTVKLYTN